MGNFTVQLLVGTLLIILGLLIKRFPMLIAGYNTMPAEQKKNVDIEGLSSFMRRHMVIIGALWVLISVGLEWCGQTKTGSLIYLFYITPYTFWMVIRAQRYDHNRK